MDSASATEYMMGWMHHVIQTLPLPDSFYLMGHSYGGYLCGLYAAQHPEKIDKLFLLSPVGVEPERPDLDLCSIRYGPEQKQKDVTPKFVKEQRELWGEQKTQM